MSVTLWRVVGPRFVAGFTATDNRVAVVAPILRRKLPPGTPLGQALDRVRDAGWRIEEVPPTPSREN